MCPGGLVHPDKEFLLKLEERAKTSGVHLVGYFDGPGHHFYIFVEAEKTEQINTFIVPLFQIGECRVAPVMKWAEIHTFGKKIGLQK